MTTRTIVFMGAVLLAAALLAAALRWRADARVRIEEALKSEGPFARARMELERLEALAPRPVGPRQETATNLIRSILDAADLHAFDMRVEPVEVEWSQLRYGLWQGRFHIVAALAPSDVPLALGAMDDLMRSQPAVLRTAKVWTDGDTVRLDADAVVLGR